MNNKPKYEGNKIDGSTPKRMVASVKASTEIDQMGQLLNRVEAIIKVKAGTISELGAALLPDKSKPAQYARAHEWIKQRLCQISKPDVLFRLQSWEAKKSKDMAKNTETLAAYKEAFEAISRHREKQ